jgi:excisionase family DNA binding protein
VTDPLCLDRAALARLLKVSLRKLYRLDDAGKLPAGIVIGSSKRWLVEDVQEWLRAGAPPRNTWKNLRSAVAAPRPREAGLH